MTDIFKQCKEKHGNGLHIYKQYCQDMRRIGNLYESKNPMRDDKTNGSFRIFEDGGFKDYATNEHGDYIDMVAKIRGVDNKAAAEHLLGLTAEVIPLKPSIKPRSVPLESVPANAPAPWTKSTQPDGHWKYHNASGEVIGCIARYNEPDGSKRFLPFRWSEGKWVSKGFPEPYPIYGAELLAARPKEPVMIVSGEKTADAARLKFPDYVVVTWPFGDHSVAKADWKQLKGREIILVADNDHSGKEAMGKLQVLIGGFFPIIPDKYPKSWDIADADTNEDLSWIFEPVKPKLKVVDYYSALKLTTGKDQKPINCIENLKEILDRIGANPRHDIIRKRNEILIEGLELNDSQRDEATLSYIESECSKFRFPTGKVDSFLTFLCEVNQYNPVKEFIESKPWDGVSRFNDICNTITTKTPHKDIYLKKWMISAVAAAYNKDGVVARGVLVFQGPQDLGKTFWFKSLFPADLCADGVTLRPDNKDSVKIAVSKWAVELGELDGSLKKDRMAEIKAFITRQEDTFRPPYARKESTFKRRTIFFASVNPNEFLVDETGNTRFWSIECLDLNPRHGIDLQQLWAEALIWYKNGESYYLDKDEMRVLNYTNNSHEMSDPIEDRIAGCLQWGSEISTWTFRTVTEILLEIGLDRPTKADVMRAKPFILKMAGDNARSSRENNLRKVLCPKRNPVTGHDYDSNDGSYKYQ